MALDAAGQAMVGQTHPPDAIILGTTTGGILTTEQLLRNSETGSKPYQYHGLTTVAEELARQFDCTGPVITVSTACSSGTAAIGIALALLRSGRARRVLAGGVDSLCRLTYFGFHSLQLVDPEGSRPMDTSRRGMSVGEGAAMLLLSTEKQADPLAEISGCGLSCDAYHPAAPHPEGRGAIMAMQAALADAGIEPEEIDYINLHGTGTPDNDQAESRAVMRLFETLPPVSSIKGATGHSLAAAGAIEAVVAALAVSRSLLPANTGCLEPDPELIRPLSKPRAISVSAVLSNSFGFGGNNGSLVITGPDQFPAAAFSEIKQPLVIRGTACLTGSGNLASTMASLRMGNQVAGMQALQELSADLPPRRVRRLKRLSRMTLSLAVASHADSGLEQNPTAVFMGTGWGALSETCDFLTRLEETREQFPSPTDFVGSVHNGPAGQVAMMFQATGANITTSGGDYSFEQALLTAELMADDEPCFVLGADEAHARFSPLFDPSISSRSQLADGGGALCLQRSVDGVERTIRTVFYRSCRTENVIAALVNSLGGEERIRRQYGLILAGIPAAVRDQAEGRLQEFLEQTGISVPVVDYRHFIGQFASASAVAAVLAAEIVASGTIPAGLTGNGQDTPCKGSILIIGLGHYITGMECGRS
jgi:3-oxoacyl-(acyl-carrier-protein) synthase